MLFLFTKRWKRNTSQDYFIKGIMIERSNMYIFRLSKLGGDISIWWAESTPLVGKVLRWLPKKQKRTAFLSVTPNIYGPSYFEAALTN